MMMGFFLSELEYLIGAALECNTFASTISFTSKNEALPWVTV